MSGAETERRPVLKINASPPTSLCSLSKPSTSRARARARARRHRTRSQRPAGPRGHFRPDRTPPGSPSPPGRLPRARAFSRRLTLRQLHGARAAQRARQTVELLHRSLHPRRGLREAPAAPAASATRALHPGTGRACGRRRSELGRGRRSGTLGCEAESVRRTDGCQPDRAGVGTSRRLRSLARSFPAAAPLPSWAREAFWEL